jgi:queuine tRNA-ribosyltransferase
MSQTKPQFKVLVKDKTTRARVGLLTTSHGQVETPTYVIVATHASIKSLKSSDIKKTKTQMVISNTYHLWDKALANINSGKIVHSILKTKIPAMTDSGGFQVFSFGAAREHNVGKVLKREKRKPGEKSAIKITEKGVYFLLDGEKRFLSPELSMEIQGRLGADIIFAFDECTSPLHSFEHNKKALERTNRWLKRCLKAKAREDQLLYGIVQGGRFNSLRKSSAKFVASLPVDGFGIGGSFGKDEMKGKLQSVIPYLPDEKPRHLLGIGKIEDIFIAIENGVDSFDCVIPTREARHARLWTNKGATDIRKAMYEKDDKIIEKGCSCPTCVKGITRSQLRKYFKNKDMEAGRWASIHNIWFFNNLVEKIRESIKK